MGVLDLLDDADVLELDVEVLVDALEGAADLDVVLELDCDLVVDQGLEETGDSCVSNMAHAARVGHAAGRLVRPVRVDGYRDGPAPGAEHVVDRVHG